MGGKKSDPIEFERRIREVQEWVLEGWPSCDMLDQIVTKWQVVERQAKRYIAEARRRWIIEDTLLLEQKRRLTIEKLKRRQRTLKDQFKGTPQGLNAISIIEKQIIALEGLNSPKKIELIGDEEKPVQVQQRVISNIDYKKLPDEALLAIVKARKD